MTTKTQTKPKNKKKRPTSPAKPKTARVAKRATPKSGNKCAQPKLTAARPMTKQATIQNLVERPDGASITELTQATTWQAHSVRAALTGLRKTGTDIVRTKDDGGTTRYCLGGGNAKKTERSRSDQ